MEPVEASVKMPIKINYSFYTKVVKVWEHEDIIKGEKENETTFLTYQKVGWFIHFEGSREALFFGTEKPPYEVGDRVKVTIEKVEPDAKANQATTN